MKYIIFCIIFIYSYTDIIAQKKKVHEIKLSVIEEMIIDSISIKETPLVLKKLNTNQFAENQVSTPEKTMQTFISINNREWGRSIIVPNYGDFFPSEQMLKNRNSFEYIKNAYVKIYFTFYFRYKNKNFAACFIEGFANPRYPKYISIFVFEYLKKRWLLTDDWYLSRLTDFDILKPQFALNLLLGKKIKGNRKYNELLDAVYKNGVLDLFLFNSQGAFDKNYYSELLNKY